MDIVNKGNTEYVLSPEVMAKISHLALSADAVGMSTLIAVEEALIALGKQGVELPSTFEGQKFGHVVVLSWGKDEVADEETEVELTVYGQGDPFFLEVFMPSVLSYTFPTAEDMAKVIKDNGFIKPSFDE